MTNVKGKSFTYLQHELLGNKVHFKSDCEFFPKFDVTGKVIRMSILNGEIIFEMIIQYSGKQLKIGSNMKNLTYKKL
jgi:hypothetical protein